MAKEVLVRPPNSFLLADHAAAELAIACHHCVVSYAKWADAASSHGRRYAHIPGLVESYPNGAFVVLGDDVTWPFESDKEKYLVIEGRVR